MVQVILRGGGRADVGGGRRYIDMYVDIYGGCACAICDTCTSRMRGRSHIRRDYVVARYVSIYIHI